MPLNPSGAISLGGPVTGQSIAVELGLSPTATISLGQTNVRTLAQVPSGAIVMPTNFWGKSNLQPTQRAIFTFGISPPAAVVTGYVTNLVSTTGVVASNVPGVGTQRSDTAGATYGGDKGIFGFGASPVSPFPRSSTTNLISNVGVVASDTPNASATTRTFLAAAAYGGDRAIFGFGNGPATVNNVTNLVSNTGVVAATGPGVGTSRSGLAAAGYGGDKAIFGFGTRAPAGIPTPRVNTTNLVSNTGVVAADTPGVGLARQGLAAAGYGGDKAIFAYGFTNTPPAAPTGAYFNTRNLVSNTGVVATDTAGAGTARSNLAAAIYGGDKAIFGFGATAPTTVVAITNLVSNTGVVAGDTPGVGTARGAISAVGYAYS